VHPRFRTPVVAIVAYAVLSLAFALYGRLQAEGGFQWNAVVSAIVRLVTDGLTCVALLVFRRAAAGLEVPAFRAPAGPALAAVATVFCLWLLATRTWAYTGLLLALVALGLLLWWPSRRGRAAVQV
jgi:amino acid transporter